MSTGDNLFLGGFKNYMNLNFFILFFEKILSKHDFLTFFYGVVNGCYIK